RCCADRAARRDLPAWAPGVEARVSGALLRVRCRFAVSARRDAQVRRAREARRGEEVPDRPLRDLPGGVVRARGRGSVRLPAPPSLPISASLTEPMRVAKNSMKAWMRAVRRRSACVSTHRDEFDLQ